MAVGKTGFQVTLLRLFRLLQHHAAPQFTAAGLDSPTRTTHYRPRFVAFSDKLPTPQLIPVACLVPTLIVVLGLIISTSAHHVWLPRDQWYRSKVRKD